jgi:hypothetical protein
MLQQATGRQSMNTCKHKQLSDWETERFDDNCEGIQV